MSARAHRVITIVTVVVMAGSIPMTARAKARTGTSSAALHTTHRRGSAEHLRALQNALTPFLNARAAQRGTTGALRYPADDVYHPTDADLFSLARNWEQLDHSFRELYNQAFYIPAGFETHVSPGGHFEVYYSMTGDEAVEPTDTYGFSPSHWRRRTTRPNGVPDYVDEVAWALDSAWSMIIDRFAFPEPIPFVDDEHTSNRYKVVLREMGPYYGYTYPKGTSGNGFASYIELENDWSGPNWSYPPTDYSHRPLEAASITCAHEFFHASQYAMAHDIASYIDDFPLGWLEGTATMMEDLAFDHVNDYIQYSTDFFSQHTARILTPYASDITVYKNSLFALYVFEHARPEPGIGFIRAVHEHRHLHREPFYQNILAGAEAVQRRWPELLGSFFTASYFTGDRADTLRFIHDAARLDSFTLLPDLLDSTGATTKYINPFAMQTFCFTPTPEQSDTCHVSFACRESEAAGELDVRLILEKPPATPRVVPLVAGDSLRGTYRIEEWRDHDRLLVVSTNASHTTSRKVTVFLTDAPLDSLPPDTADTTRPPDTSDSTLTPSDSTLPAVLAVYPNPVSRSRHRTIAFESADLLEVTLYSADGLTVRRAIIDPNLYDTPLRSFRWDLRNQRGTPVLPGTYVALVGRTDPHTKGIRYQRTRVLVVP